MGKSNMTVKTVEIDVTQAKSLTHLKELLQEAEVPDEIIDKVAVGIWEEIQSDRGEEIGLRVVGGKEHKSSFKAPDEDADDLDERTFNAIVEGIIERCEFDAEQKVTVSEGIRIIEKGVGQDMPKDVRRKVKDALKGVKTIKFRAFCEAAVKTAPDSAFSLAKGLVGLLDIIKELSNILESDDDEGEDRASRLADKDPDGRYVVEDMVVQRKGTQEFYKVLRAETSGQLTIAPVADIIESGERIEIEAKNFGRFLQDYKCVWDPRDDEYAMDGTPQYNTKH